MCDTYKHPSDPKEEIGLAEINKLPTMDFVNITGGEPFVRTDVADIVEALLPRAKRIVISTNGYFTERIVELVKRFPQVGIRISIEGLQEANDAIRGILDGYNRGLKTLYALREMGIKDIGFGMTIQRLNARDLIKLYQLSCELGYEFATAALHNSHYFHKLDNSFSEEDKQVIIPEIEQLIAQLLKSNSPKKWFRAYFNHGLINYIKGNKRLLPCEMGTDGFFLDPVGDVLACNGMDTKMSMGNLKQSSFEEIWISEQAQKVRAAVKNCPKNCWMIGSVAPAMKKNIFNPALWVVQNKLFGYLARDRKRRLIYVLIVIALLALFLFLYWWKCQLGINLCREFSLSAFPPFKWLAR
ncbi:radical SAM protein [Candidatus Margulisiibacteriota bacterium]